MRNQEPPLPPKMVVEGTPVEYLPDLGLWVKREDLCCPLGPHFSKTRGVYRRALSSPEKLIGVLDTSHSQGGWAVARACALLGKQCMLFYPERKSEIGFPLKPQQQAARDLGAILVPLPAGRSAVLYHRAKAQVEAKGGYMFPNALKLWETVQETKLEFLRTKLPKVDRILISASSGTIASGLIHGAYEARWKGQITVHMGYSRPSNAVKAYLNKMSGAPLDRVEIIDEGYAYVDEANSGPNPSFPCNSFYDLKAFRWWAQSDSPKDSTLLWNVG